MKKISSLFLLVCLLTGAIVTLPVSFSDEKPDEAMTIDRFWVSGVPHGFFNEENEVPLTFHYSVVKSGFLFHGTLTRYAIKTDGGRWYGLYQGYMYNIGPASRSTAQ